LKKAAGLNRLGSGTRPGTLGSPAGEELAPSEGDAAREGAGDAVAALAASDGLSNGSAGAAPSSGSAAAAASGAPDFKLRVPTRVAGIRGGSWLGTG
jgi:hypothetical protein